METSDHWRRAEQLFEGAIALPPEERQAYLDETCGDTPTLRFEVESLLAAHASAESFLESPAFELSDCSDEVDHVPGTMVGSYRIERLLAAGGMGIVYAATHVTSARRVALKVLRGGALLDERQRRWFRRETRVLARLDHPNIARLHDAGVTLDGLHYFALELVDGEPLCEFARRRRLPTRERLGLFLQVCAAVHHAHRSGVIHRDLKPANILVQEACVGAGTEPVVKVLDFGLARIVDRRTTATSIATRHGQVLGTLHYMSPEQARGDVESVDARSDVYSLGVVLHELLTDRLPIEMSDTRPHDAMRAIAESAPARPSSVDRRLRGDVDTMVLKALEKDPAQRYADVESMWGDIRRFLEGAPIEASPPSMLRQLRGFVGRHRVLCGFAATLFLVLTSTSIAMAVLYARAIDAERRARHDAEIVSETNRLLEDMLYHAVAPELNDGREVTVREVLARAAERLSADPIEPEVASALHSTVGNAYASLGHYDDAERHLERSLTLCESLHEPPYPRLAESCADLAELLRLRGDYARSEGLFARALEQWRALQGTEDPTYARVLGEMAGTVRFRGDLDRAEGMYREALAIQRRVAPDDPALGFTLGNLAGLLGAKGNDDEARALYEQALAIVAHHQTSHAAFEAGTLNNLASLHLRAGRPADALPLFREALVRYRQLVDEEHPAIATVLHNLGRALAASGELDAAETTLREAMALRRRVLGDAHPHLATTLHALASTLLARDRPEDLPEAEALLRESRAMASATLGETHPQVVLPSLDLARLLARTRRPREAMELARECLWLLHDVPEDDWRKRSAQEVVARFRESDVDESR